MTNNMFTRNSQIIIDKENISNYFDGFDIYNSYILNLLSDPSIKKDIYLITKYDYRPDLIAEDYYGSTKYMGLLLLTTGLSLEDFKKGTVLELIPKRDLDNILNKL